MELSTGGVTETIFIEILHVKMATQNLLRLLLMLMLMLRNVLTIAWKLKFGHKVQFCKILPSYTGQEQACTLDHTVVCLFVLVFHVENGPIHKKIVVDCPWCSYPR